MINKLAIEYVRNYCKEACDEDIPEPLNPETVVMHLSENLRLNLVLIYEQGKERLKQGLYHYDVDLNMWFKSPTACSLSVKEIGILLGDWETVNKFDFRGNYAADKKL